MNKYYHHTTNLLQKLLKKLNYKL